ncbi:hypothetical protein vseg_001980 [Gypsophila vaccaria]
MTRISFKGIGLRANDLLGLIHTDVCGPMLVTARDGYRYFITFTDDLSRYGYVYLMKHKSESFEKFKEFQNKVENQLDKKIKALRSDRGGEYLSNEFDQHLKDCGIVSQLTPPGTPQLNGQKSDPIRYGSIHDESHDITGLIMGFCSTVGRINIKPKSD